MMRVMLKSKIHCATVTDTNLDYEGSLTIDAALMEAAGLIANEQVDVLNLNNGERFTTYVIEGGRGSGDICVNGAAARLVHRGDKVIILSYALVNEEELEGHRVRVVFVDERNKITGVHEKTALPVRV
ncbi:MAG: aspartate 1-decarboxylase [Armatimonadota bacterium]|nr:aspartate 1-decarboxylase [Armatimonadota bacterium]MCX7778272.1 aspartate 1-decarboxylase [Armatimonadota bacterium]MDW8026301.1 aspartate 1-decarboxylase [Armatimonadota bacterium]